MAIGNATVIVGQGEIWVYLYALIVVFDGPLILAYGMVSITTAGINLGIVEAQVYSGIIVFNRPLGLAQVTVRKTSITVGLGIARV